MSTCKVKFTATCKVNRSDHNQKKRERKEHNDKIEFAQLYMPSFFLNHQPNIENMLNCLLYSFYTNFNWVKKNVLVDEIIRWNVNFDKITIYTPKILISRPEQQSPNLWTAWRNYVHSSNFTYIFTIP